MRDAKNIAIIGVGLIGSSLALRLHEKKLAKKIIGVDTNQVHLEEAMSLEIIDEVMSLDDAIAYADVLILTTPVHAQLELLPIILNQINKNQIVIDVGSTKLPQTEIAANHANNSQYIPTHPMWGTEFSGPTAAQKNAFENKAVVFCTNAHTNVAALAWVIKMYEKIGMHVTFMQPEAHDLHVAYVSHIAHIAAFALANTVLEKEREEKTIFELASAGLESTVRLAKSSANMWVPILLQNKNNVLDVLGEHIQQLQAFKNAIENSDAAMLENLIKNANNIKHALNK